MRKLVAIPSLDNSPALLFVSRMDEFSGFRTKTKDVRFRS